MSARAEPAAARGGTAPAGADEQGRAPGSARPRQERPPRRLPEPLRRNAALLGLVLGAFLVTSALLLRFYVAGQLALLPAEVDQRVRLVDESGTYLDTGTWRTVADTEVELRTDIRGTPSPGNSGWSTWQMSVDVAAGQDMVSHLDRRVIVDRATGMAVNCCGEHVDGDRAVRQAGLVFQWPAGARWPEYPFYDADLRAAPRMVDEGPDEVGGLAVRRYVQRVEPTQIPDSARPVPASALGLERGGVVEANRWLELERVYWVEPVTGRVVDIAEERHETLRPAAGGGGERTLLDARFTMPQEVVDAHVRQAAERRALLRAARAWLPAGLGAAGVLLLPAAAWRVLRPRAGAGGGADTDAAAAAGEGAGDSAVRR
ncbi:DUF3068 domain-containing protein [Streptomonospora nanhaiensis]|uniref:DUF3068 domain-containing protein n=1 Tax=Streptomonospora nanhaiensis TaxID=1323731 RepID=A0A853BND7_9ACTN|nr:DUF3068 domain-containing protein [Streptomonospora nanhaiensis]NYI96031.1 hypothetical protein [Streptomonospora nanhaiensis]